MKIIVFFDLLLSVIIYFHLKVIRKFSLGNKILFQGIPIIDISHKSKIAIGSNVVINSRNRGYHINMHSPTKLMADRSGEIIIGNNTRIHGTCIHSFKKISIGKNCLIAANTQIIDGNGHDLSLDNPENRINTFGKAKEIIIEDNVWIGSNCIILPGSIIRNGSIISANSVVKGEIPSNSIAEGNPAIILNKN